LTQHHFCRSRSGAGLTRKVIGCTMYILMQGCGISFKNARRKNPN